MNTALRRCADLGTKAWLQYCALACAGILVHLPALQAQFVWDDVYLARDNPFIKSPLLALEAFRHHLFLDSTSAHYRPTQNLSYLLDYYLWNTDACGFHLTNIALHVTAGLLLFRLLTRLFGNGGGVWPHACAWSPRLGALLIASIWMVHPVHSAAVDYVSGRADSLAFALSAGAWLLYLRAGESRRRWAACSCYCSASFGGLLALCSREIAIAWVLVFLLHTLGFAVGMTRGKKVATLCACLLLLGCYAALRQLPDHSRVTQPTSDWPAPLRVTLMLRSLGDYARLMVWPSNLHMERTVFEPEAFRSQISWRKAARIEYLSFIGAATALLFGLGSLRKSTARRLRILGALWFFFGFLPVSNIVQLNATVAEHWLYLPSVGALIFLIGCAVDLPARIVRLLPAFGSIVVVALGVRSAIRSTDWHDEETFFTRTLAAGGRSGRILVNLAQCYTNRGLYSRAEEICRRILAIDPHYSVARNNLAFALSREGKTGEAEALFAKSAKDAPVYSKAYPRTWLAARNLAQLRHDAGDDATAIDLLEHVRRDYPNVWELTGFESELLRETKHADQALALVREFVARNWWHQIARLAEGQLYAETGDAARAEEALRFAALLDVHDVEALNLLAHFYSAQQRFADARRAQLRAIARQPDKPSQYFMLANIEAAMGEKAEAQLTLEKVSRMREMARAMN